MGAGHTVFSKNTLIHSTRIYTVVMSGPIIKFMVQNLEESAICWSIYPLPLKNPNNAKFEFLMSVFKNMQVFWDVIAVSTDK